MNYLTRSKSATKATWLTTLCLILGTLVTSANEAARRVTIVRVPGASKIVKAQMGGDNTIHVLLDSEDGPRYVKSTDAGITFSAPITIVDAASQKPDLKFQGEDLAVGKDGRVHVAMSNNAWKLKLPEEEWGFYYASLAPGDKAFTQTRNINH